MHANTVATCIKMIKMSKVPSFLWKPSSTSTLSSCVRGQLALNKWSKKPAVQQTVIQPMLAGAVTTRRGIRRPMGLARTFCTTTGVGNKMEIVYKAPLKGAVRAVKIFSLATAVASVCGGPVLVWLGNPSVPVIARVMITSVVVLVGLGTTAILHWMVKGDDLS